MNFTKMHGAGNDYVFVDGTSISADWPELARRVSDRHFGVGSDGLIVAARSDVADIKMRMWNSDGSESEMCGNGLRCFIKFVLDHKILRGQHKVVSVETGAGILSATPHLDKGSVTTASVQMGVPEVNVMQIPADPANAGYNDVTYLQSDVLSLLNSSPENILFDAAIKLPDRNFIVTAVSMGNPHAVAFIDDPVEGIDLDKYGPMMENHPAFPHRVNFHIANIQNSGRIVTRTWERGAGQTLACGTGACAMLVAGRLHGFLDETVVVKMPGGELTVSWTGIGSVTMEGPVEEVFNGVLQAS